jgi:cupin 2 domain-containing protein
MAGNIRIEKIEKNNIFEIKDIKVKSAEIFQNILSGKRIKLERIISSGQTTPDGIWLSEKTDEWVILLKGRAGISFHSGEKIKLEEGDYILIKSGTKHRVSYTSKNPECIWLAIHGKLTV